MPGGPPTRGGGEESSPSGIAARLEELTEVLARNLSAPPDAASREELDGCLHRLRHLSSSVRGMELLVDAHRPEALARREAELRSIALATSETIRLLAQANGYIAEKVGGQIQELDEVAALPVSEEMAARLRHVASEVREAAREMEGRLEDTSKGIDQASERIAALERELGEARRKALYDALTRLYSRAALDERLKAAIGEAEGSGPWCFLIADIDHFKAVNDQYGHLVGDAFLYKVARVIETALRQKTGEGFLARYGGEEFAIVLPQAALAHAGEIAEEIRQRVGLTSWQRRGHEGEAPLHATISIGVAQYRPGDTAASLVERADQALYRAKNAGRDRIALAPQ